MENKCVAPRKEGTRTERHSQDRGSPRSFGRNESTYVWTTWLQRLESVKQQDRQCVHLVDSLRQRESIQCPLEFGESAGMQARLGDACVMTVILENVYVHSHESCPPNTGDEQTSDKGWCSFVCSHRGFVLDGPGWPLTTTHCPTNKASAPLESYKKA